MDRLQEEATKLRELGRLKPTAERIGLVREALESKWEGMQSVALQVLAAWRGKESIQTMRDFLNDAFTRRYGWSIRGVAVDALGQVVGSEDVDWVLDLYFSRPTVLDKHELLPLVLKLPVAQARQRLVAELSSNDPLNRHAAVKAIGNMDFIDRDSLLQRLQNDDVKGVRESAKALASKR